MYSHLKNLVVHSLEWPYKYKINIVAVLPCQPVVIDIPLLCYVFQASDFVFLHSDAIYRYIITLSGFCKQPKEKHVNILIIFFISISMLVSS